MLRLLTTGLAIAAGVITCTATPAQAARTTAQAVSICQPALPAFDGLIRKRPLAVQNEGAEPAFVTCAFANTGPSTGHRISAAQVQLQNLGGVSRTVQCTAVNSNASAAPGAPLYASKSATVAAGATVAMDFAADEFPGGAFVLPGDTLSVSCNLPAGTGITGTVLQNNA